VYAALFGSVHRWLFDDVFDSVTRNLTVERTAFFVRLAMYVVFFVVVGVANLLFDFTKVRMVVEDRHSVIGSIASAGQFIRANPRVAMGAYAMNVIAFVLVLATYALIAPGAGSADWTMWSGFLVGQLYIAARLAVRLAFWGGEIAALQIRFGCPGFVRTGT
ncbi:MAG TPA: hypothetical protein VM032_06835, partial [Vicinamibacterales bacterium]|nr:hypothetical protein [Vicinamibacterales bacterium]